MDISFPRLPSLLGFNPMKYHTAQGAQTRTAAEQAFLPSIMLQTSPKNLNLSNVSDEAKKKVL
jgi:hypothetical protein